MFHTAADRARAISALSTHFRALASDLAAWLRANPGSPASVTSAQWFEADVTPMLEEWRDFVVQQRGSWWNQMATSWETYEEWWARLRQHRALARAHGIELQSVEPVPLPKTIWQRGSLGEGGEATAILGILKIGVVGALAITGAATLLAVARELGPRRTHA